MNKIALITLCWLYIINVKAQTLNSINGTSVQLTDFRDVKGSPYFYNDWLKGDVIMSDDVVHQNMDLRYNLVDDQLYFKSSNQSVLTFADPVKQFTINAPEGSIQVLTFRKGYQNIPGTTSTSFLEILTEGKTQLLKKFSKKIQTENVYPNTSTDKFFTETKTYYIFKDGKGILIRLDKKSIISALSNKQTELETYIKQNNLNLKDDEDLRKLITYYNSISNL